MNTPSRYVLISMLLFTLLSASAYAETITVKYRKEGPVDLAPFSCQDITRSSFIRRTCYDEKNEYFILKLQSSKLKTTYYHYCEFDRASYDRFHEAPSMGKYYNRHIKSRGGDGPFDCRTHRVPTY